MNRYFGVFLIVAFLIAGSIVVYSVNNVNEPQADKISQELSSFGQPQAVTPAQNTKKMEVVTDLKVEDIKVGDGEEVKAGGTVEVHYLGTLMDGTKFDSSYDRGQTFETKIPGQVIEGWNQGILGMKVGGKRKLTIPSHLGYGDSGSGPIPPKASLIFEVELISKK